LWHRAPTVKVGAGGCACEGRDDVLEEGPAGGRLGAVPLEVLGGPCKARPRGRADAQRCGAKKATARKFILLIKNKWGGTSTSSSSGDNSSGVVGMVVSMGLRRVANIAATSRHHTHVTLIRCMYA
jgi:hypothetical protein